MNVFIQKVSVRLFNVVPKRDFYSRELSLSDDMVAAVDVFNKNQGEYQAWLKECYNTAEGRASSGAPQPEAPEFFKAMIREPTKETKNVDNKPERVREASKTEPSSKEGEV